MAAAQKTVAIGSPVTFSVTGDGTQPFTYQWRKNGANIASATAGLFTLPSAQATDAATYTVFVSNSLGSGLSDDGVLTVSSTGGPNTAPTISGIPYQTVTAGTSTGPLPFTVNDAETPPANLTMTALSGDTAFIPLSGIVFGGSGANRTVTVTPANQVGGAWVTIAVSDGALSAVSNFFVEAKAGPSGNVNDPPSGTSVTPIP